MNLHLEMFGLVVWELVGREIESLQGSGKKIK
jgi:hypothetical protein